MSKEPRYLLYGYGGSHIEYLINSNDLEELKLEAIVRLNEGYTAYILDKETGIETIFSLRK